MYDFWFGMSYNLYSSLTDFLFYKYANEVRGVRLFLYWFY